MTGIAAPVAAGLATSRRTDAQQDRGRGTQFGAQDIARRQTVPAMVGLRYLGTQIKLRHRPLSPFMRQQSFLGVLVTDDAGRATSRKWPSATDIVLQRNVGSWGKSGSRLHSLEMT